MIYLNRYLKKEQTTKNYFYSNRYNINYIPKGTGSTKISRVKIFIDSLEPCKVSSGKGLRKIFTRAALFIY